MRAMIVDDEAPAPSELRYLLEETGRIDGIMEASSAREAVERLMDGKVDVMFLDIQMPKTSGMQLAEALHKLKNPPAIVFVTAYSEYALDAFGVDAVDYLMKPVEPERLAQALDKVQGRMKPEEPQSHSAVERIPVVKMCIRDRLNPEHPHARGSHENGDIFFQHREACNKAYDELPAVVEKYMGKINEKLGKMCIRDRA